MTTDGAKLWSKNSFLHKNPNKMQNLSKKMCFAIDFHINIVYNKYNNNMNNVHILNSEEIKNDI